MVSGIPYTPSSKINGIKYGVQRQPSFASISPYNNGLKPKGNDVESTMGNFTLVHTKGTQNLNGLNQSIDRRRAVNPWLRALSVDRRIDYDLVILGPVIGNTFNLYPSVDDGESSDEDTSKNKAPKKNRDGEIEPMNYKLKYVLNDGTSGEIPCNDSDVLTSGEVSSYISSYQPKLKEIIVGDCTRRVDGNCFLGCTSITSVIFSENVKEIGSYAFSNCYSLNVLTIPSGMFLAVDSFLGCRGLTYLTIEGIDCDDCTSQECYQGRTVIMDYAFASCGNLSTVVFTSSCPPQLGFDAFKDASSSLVLYVPSGCSETYKRAMSQYREIITDGGDEPEPPDPGGGGGGGDTPTTIGGGEDYAWKATRVFGKIYNGIEMSYDAEYNVIHADEQRDENDVATAATTTNRLEYTYSYNGDEGSDAKTTYNIIGDGVWEGEGDNRNQIIKRFYSLEIGGRDIRNFVWSDFNSKRLKEYIESEQRYGGDVFRSIRDYVFHYPLDDHQYNGDFNRESVVGGNYPTQRYIDVGCIQPMQLYNISIEGCSYEMGVGIEDDDTLKAQTEMGESVGFNIEFGNLITFIPPSSDKKYANIVYSKNGNEDGYSKFIAKNYNVDFKYNLISSSEFDIYTSTPRIIWVLKDNECNTDGLTIIKSANPESEIGLGGDGIPFDFDEFPYAPHIINVTRNILKRVEIHKFIKASKRKIYQAQSQDIFVPNGVKNDDMVFRELFRKSGSKGEAIENLVRSDESDFENIIFSHSGSLGDVKAFAIGAIRLYLHKDREYEHLTKRVHTIEISEIFDARDILIKVLDEDSSGTTTYVVKQNLTQIDIPSPEPPEPPEPDDNNTNNEESTTNTEDTNTEGDEANTSDGEGGDTTEDVDVYLQVITFEMKFNFSENSCPAQLQNQAFADYDMMSYTFVFSNFWEQYEIECTEFEAIQEGENGNILKIRFVVRWTQEMGLLADDKWTACIVSLYAKSTSTSSNFVYKLEEFLLKHPSEQTKPSEVGYENREPTQTEIL